jgi:hypothetical protein
MTKREAMQALNNITALTPIDRDAKKQLRAYLDSLPPDPFVLPPPGTEFAARVDDRVREFYVTTRGEVREMFKGVGYTREWFTNAGAEIVEET